MLNDYQLQVLFFDDMRVPLLYALVISSVYYFFSRRVLSSIHGALIIFAFLYSVISSGFTEYGAANYWYWPLNVLLILAIASAIYSIREFGTKRWVHVAHLGTLGSAAFIWFAGSMAIAHDWI